MVGEDAFVEGDTDGIGETGGVVRAVLVPAAAAVAPEERGAVMKRSEEWESSRVEGSHYISSATSAPPAIMHTGPCHVP